MIIIKTDSEIERLKKGGPILADILRKVAARVAPGVTTAELDIYAYELIKKSGHKPAFLDYQPEGATFPYPASLCVSVNSEVVHGIPGKKVLKEGDIVSIDLGLNYEGVFLDHATTVAVGEVSAKNKLLMGATKEALDAGIEAIVPGARLGDIGYAIQSVAERNNLGIVYGFSGHGVGRAIHEDPYVMNTGRPGKGEALVPGMVIAIEPMFTLGGEDVVLGKDGFTYKTEDGSRAAHYEHTVLITETGAEVLTK